MERESRWVNRSLNAGALDQNACYSDGMEFDVMESPLPEESGPAPVIGIRLQSSSHVLEDADRVVHNLSPSGAHGARAERGWAADHTGGCQTEYRRTRIVQTRTLRPGNQAQTRADSACAESAAAERRETVVVDRPAVKDWPLSSARRTTQVERPGERRKQGPASS